MSEFKSLNGYTVKDETARKKAEENAQAIDDLNTKLSKKGIEILFHYNNNDGVLLSHGETFTVTNEIKSILESGNYLLKINVCSNSTYSSTYSTAVIGSIGTHYSVLMDRNNLTPNLIRLSMAGNTITFNMYGSNNACYLSQVVIYKL